MAVQVPTEGASHRRFGDAKGLSSSILIFNCNGAQERSEGFARLIHVVTHRGRDIEAPRQHRTEHGLLRLVELKVQASRLAGLCGRPPCGGEVPVAIQSQVGVQTSTAANLASPAQRSPLGSVVSPGR